MKIVLMMTDGENLVMELVMILVKTILIVMIIIKNTVVIMVIIMYDAYHIQPAYRGKIKE